MTLTRSERVDRPPLAPDIRTGIIAACASVVVFATVHHLLISNIWFSLPMMLVAGAISGAALAWNYRMLSEEPSVPSWLAYNAAWVGTLLVLAGASMVAFEPIVTMEELLTNGGPPTELFGRAFPLTFVFSILAAAAMTALWGWTWLRLCATVASSAAITLLLGLNISTIGLVEIPGESALIVAEFFALVVLLDLVYAGGFIALARGTLSRSSPVSRLT